MTKKENTKTVKKEILEKNKELEEVEEFEDFEKFEDEEMENNVFEENDINLEEKDEDYENLSLEDRIINVEKKTNAIFIFVIIITILAALNLAFVVNSSSYSNSDSSTNTESLGDYDVSDFEEISASDIEKLSKKETIVVYIGRSTCGYCIQYLPILKEVQTAYGYTTKYIDIAKILDFESTTGGILDQEAYETLINMSTSDDQKGIMDQFGSTPMTLVIKKNKIINSVVGLVDSATLGSLLQKSGFDE